MNKKTVGIFVGSLRRESYSKKVARYLADLLGEQFTVKVLDISALPLYNEDLDNEDDMPKEWKDFREDVKAFSAVLFVTPEYNRSLPAVLKNALDVASRPKKDNVWNGKPGAVVSVSPGKIGGFGANHHLRQIATCLNISMMQQPEAYVGEISGAVNADGISDTKVREVLQRFVSAYIDWVNRF